MLTTIFLSHVCVKNSKVKFELPLQQVYFWAWQEAA